MQAALKRKMAELPSRRSSLYFGYPCSVDAGVDPVKRTKQIIAQCRKQIQDAQRLHEDHCRLPLECSVDSSDAQMIENAKKRPCSVDAGVDSVKDTEQIIDQCRKQIQDAQRLREDHCRLTLECSVDSSDAQMIENAENAERLGVMLFIKIRP